MLQAIGKIQCSKLKALPSVLLVSFSTDNNNQGQNPFPRNRLDLPPKQPRYDHKINYNFEEFRKYTKAVKEAKEMEQKEQELELKIKSGQEKHVSRRSRRIYNAPRYDEDLSNYAVWRVFDRELVKPLPHSLPVVCKIALAPKFVLKAFGVGKEPWRNPDATLEFDFEDKNLDCFLLYDYRSTTKTYGPNRPGYDYENQESVHPRKRIQRWPTPEEFWNSEEDYQFRVNCSEYADFRKFRRWVITRVQEAKEGKVEAYEERIAKKFGEVETYDNYDKKYELISDPAVFKYTRSYYLQPGEKHEKQTKYHLKLEPAKKLDDKHKINYDVETPKTS